jgi:hypothetical protein
VNEAPIQIRNPDVIRAIRELAARRQLPITEVVGEAVNAELGRLGCLRDSEVERRLTAIRAVTARIARLPVLGPTPTDADFYDEDGCPK